MYSIDDVNFLLDEIAEELPEEVFRELNGGVSLLDEVRRNVTEPNGGLYTLGEYRHDQMGRYIVLYYGSIRIIHGRESPDVFRESLRKLLVHELTHHIESLAGDRSLELDDARRLRDYFGRFS